MTWYTFFFVMKTVGSIPIVDILGILDFYAPSEILVSSNVAVGIGRAVLFSLTRLIETVYLRNISCTSHVEKFVSISKVSGLHPDSCTDYNKSK